MSARAQQWVTAFERWTSQNLGALTLWWLRNTLSPMFLLKRRKAWCPVCYEDDNAGTGIVYERLLWAIHPVAICPCHGVLLETKCTTCGQTQPALGVRSRPGHCSACGHWLGRKGSKVDLTTAPVKYQMYVAESVGELLACATAAGRLSGAKFRANLQTCVNRLAYRNLSAFAEFTHISYSPLQSWLAGTMRPRLDVLLRMCFHLGITASELLTSQRLSAVDWRAIESGFPVHDRGVKSTRTPAQVRRLLKAALRADESPSISDLSTRLGYRKSGRLYQVDAELCRKITVKHHISGRSHWWRRPGAVRICEIDTMRSTLEQALREDSPVSVRSVAARLGYANGGFLPQKFPDLCHAISQRFRVWKQEQNDAFRSRVISACHEDPPPTLRELSQRLGLGSATVLRGRFRAETDALLRARATHAQKETEKLRVAVLFVVCRESAPSLKSVGRQLGVSVSNLFEKFPALCRAIRSNYVRHRHGAARQRSEILNGEVHRTAKALYSAGENPTLNRIQDLLGEDSSREWRALQRAARRARRSLGLA